MDIAEGRRLLQEATQGEWVRDGWLVRPGLDGMAVFISDSVPTQSQSVGMTWHPTDRDDVESAANAALIVWLHNNAVALLNAAEALDRAHERSIWKSMSTADATTCRLCGHVWTDRTEHHADHCVWYGIYGEAE